MTTTSPSQRRGASASGERASRRSHRRARLVASLDGARQRGFGGASGGDEVERRRFAERSGTSKARAAPGAVDARRVTRRAGGSRPTSRTVGSRGPSEGDRARRGGPRSCAITAASSAFATMATALARSAAKRAPFSRATSATRAADALRRARRPTLVTTATSGSAMDASAAISPRQAHPHLERRRSDARGSSPRATAGTPTRLLRFPAVAWHVAHRPRRRAAVISFVVVLPALPVIATTRRRGRPRRHRAQMRAREVAPGDQGVLHFDDGDAAERRRGVAPRSTTTSAAPAPIAGGDVLVAVVELPAERDEGAPGRRPRGCRWSRRGPRGAAAGARDACRPSRRQLRAP